MSDLTSVIVPVGRVDADLETQLRALAAEHPPFTVEFVLSVNSADRSEADDVDALIGAIGDDRFRATIAAERRGAAYARNVGAAAAEGDVLAFCDGDDIIEPGWIEAIVRGLDTADAVGGRLIDAGLTDRQRLARPPSTPDALPEFLGAPYIGSGNLTIRREAFEAVGGFDEELIRCEDVAFSWSLIVAGYRLGYAHDAAVTYRHRSGVPAMLRQHFGYGRGLGQVLVKYGVPVDGVWTEPSGLSFVRPNAQPTGYKISLLGVLRRVSLAAGRVVGLGETRWHKRRRRSA
jgi:GT2 family glycosyltransferase